MLHLLLQNLPFLKEEFPSVTKLPISCEFFLKDIGNISSQNLQFESLVITVEILGVVRVKGQSLGAILRLVRLIPELPGE